jgi:predicted dehydrogenase
MTVVAVVGTGSAGMKHLAALNKIQDVQTIAIPMRPERRKQLEDMGYSTAAAIAEATQSGVTHCVVATDSGRHRKDCIEAIDNGLHILCEKPLATNSLDAKEMRSRALEANRGLYVGCVLRFSESLNTFREHLAEVGDLHSVRVEYRSYLPDWRPDRSYQQSYSGRADEGGILLDLTHEFDYTGWLFGWPDSVFAKVSNLGRLSIQSSEIAELNWQTSTGCIVSIGIDYLSRPPRREIAASGQNGTITWNWLTGRVGLVLADKDPISWDSNQSVDDLFLRQAQTFLETTAGDFELGSKNFMATGDDGYKAIVICDAACQSSESKREEAIEYL